jgi:AcrR family transcriptional regulator
VYRSEQRSAQAQRTRERIVAAADEQFTRSGYTATTMRAIAASAGVSLASVEVAFGTKAQLLKTAIDIAIAGDHAPVPVLARDWAAEAQAATNARDFLTVVARTARPAMVRSAGLVLAAFDAAATDPALRSLADQLSDQRSTTVAWIVDGVIARAPLRTGLTRQEATDHLFHRSRQWAALSRRGRPLRRELTSAEPRTGGRSWSGDAACRRPGWQETRRRGGGGPSGR